MNTDYDLAIVGAGITGLAAAYFSQQKYPTQRILLIDSSDRVGGKIDSLSFQHEEGDFLLESAADSFVTFKPGALALAKELGLESQFLPTQQAYRQVYVLKNGKLIALPDGLQLVIPSKLWPFMTSPLFSMCQKLRMGLDLLKPRNTHHADESVGDFILRRLGKDAVDLLAQPMLAGIYNTDVYTQSLQATFPQLKALETKHRSLILATFLSPKKNSSLPAFMSFRHGMKTLPQAIVDKLLCDIHLKTSLSQIRPHQNAYALQHQDGLIHAKKVLLCTPAQKSAEVLQEAYPDLSKALNDFHTTSSAAVYLAYHKNEAPIPKGYGLIIPRREKRPISAITFVSQKFEDRAPDDCVLLRVFFGANSNNILDEHDDTLTEIAQKQLFDILGISATPLFSKAIRHRAASPQYNVGHLQRMSNLKGILPHNLFLLGSPYEGVGIADCIAQAAALS